jgi:hypothetical protein
MRLSVQFIELVRQNCYEPGSQADRILTAIVIHRRAHDLDLKLPIDPTTNPSGELLDYEVRKLATVFASIQTYTGSRVDQLDVIELLKGEYPAGEVDEIVAEYFEGLSACCSTTKLDDYARL